MSVDPNKRAAQLRGQIWGGLMMVGLAVAFATNDFVTPILGAIGVAMVTTAILSRTGSN
jgi:hypothetical protein